MSSVFLCRYKYLYSAEKRLKTDGINSLIYKRLDLQFRKTYTWVYVTFNEADVLAVSHLTIIGSKHTKL